MDDFIFSDDPRQQAGGVFDPLAATRAQEDPKDTNPFLGNSVGVSFGSVGREDPFEGEAGKPQVDEELSEEELMRIQDAERAYQSLMQRLYEKDNEERLQKSDRQSEARETIEKWKDNRRKQVEQRKSLNREQEAAFLEARQSYKAGNPWKNVCSMIDFKEKSDGKDVSRMRSVLLARKNEG